jgi:Flp pilus assembly protein TadG
VRPAAPARRGDGERASAVVEFALALPLVLTMAVALLQVGLLVKDQVVLEGVARAAAREGAVTTDDARVHQAAVDAAAGLDPERLQVEVRRQGGGGTPVEVRVTYRAPADLPLVRWLFPEAIDLRATAVMRQETG